MYCICGAWRPRTFARRTSARTGLKNSERPRNCNFDGGLSLASLVCLVDWLVLGPARAPALAVSVIIRLFVYPHWRAPRACEEWGRPHRRPPLALSPCPPSLASCFSASCILAVLGFARRFAPPDCVPHTAVSLRENRLFGARSPNPMCKHAPYRRLINGKEKLLQ